MKRRKSPYKHRVKEHKRLGRPVQSYMRGQGDKTKFGRRGHRRGGLGSRSAKYGGNPGGNPGRSRIVGNPSSPSNPSSPLGGGYDVSIHYVDYRSERFSVDAKDYPSALMGGLEQRDTIEPPKMIRMRRARDG